MSLPYSFSYIYGQPIDQTSKPEHSPTPDSPVLYADGPTSCGLCERSFRDYIAKLQHIRDSDNHNVCITCDKDYEYDSFEDLRKHYVESGEHSYCAKCEEHFDERGRGPWYWQHMELKHYYCKSCQFQLETIPRLNQHLEEFHFCCVRCEKQCGDEQKLKIHKEISGRHWICDQCLGDFPSKSKLSKACTSERPILPTFPDNLRYLTNK